MQLSFRNCDIDTALRTLRCDGTVRQIEPLVFDLLVYLLRNRERIVTRQELLDALWAGKVVSESALSSCVKAARQAIGDNGEAQTCIATIQRHGYRFVAPVSPVADTRQPAAAPIYGPAAGREADAAPRRASIAVMPFVDQSPDAAPGGSLAGALVHDVITRLAQLRSLFVIAQGTVFALSERKVAPQDAGRLLNVDYLVSGTIRRHAGELLVSVELIETAGTHIVWADTLHSRQDDALRVLEEIGSQIVAHVASEVETSERNRAILKPPESLDAWAAHHRGLWHMYRFNREDNAQAQRFFQMAVQLDPTFSRAYAGLSFTHFQNAFQGWTDREPEVDRAYATASQGLSIDERNPAAHWAMGRALWLRGQHDPSVAELEQAVDLSPSFALGHYTLAFVHSQAGDAQAAIAASDQSRLLSPYDPLLFGILGSRAMALARLGRFEEAASWAVKAAARPNAHVHILGIAAYCLALAGQLTEARTQAAAIQSMHPGYRIDDFLRAFHFDAEGAALFRQGAARIGMA